MWFWVVSKDPKRPALTPTSDSEPTLSVESYSSQVSGRSEQYQSPKTHLPEHRTGKTLRIDILGFCPNNIRGIVGDKFTFSRVVGIAGYIRGVFEDLGSSHYDRRLNTSLINRMNGQTRQGLVGVDPGFDGTRSDLTRCSDKRAEYTER